jgi:hypothetical protein
VLPRPSSDGVHHFLDRMAHDQPGSVESSPYNEATQPIWRHLSDGICTTEHGLPPFVEICCTTSFTGTSVPPFDVDYILFRRTLHADITSTTEEVGRVTQGFALAVPGVPLNVYSAKLMPTTMGVGSALVDDNRPMSILC